MFTIKFCFDFDIAFSLIPTTLEFEEEGWEVEAGDVGEVIEVLDFEEEDPIYL